MGVLGAVVGGFASGIFLRSVFVFGWPVIAFTFIITTIFAGARVKWPRRAYSLAAVFCLLVSLGMLRAGIADTPLPASFASHLRQRVSYEGIVVADPDLRDANQRVEIRISSGGETTTMLAVAPRTPTVAVGDTVSVSGTLALPEPFATDGSPPSPNGSGGASRTFRYDKYLERDGVRFILNFAYLRVVQGAPLYSIFSALARVKHLFLGGLQATLPEPYASLAGGIVIGGKTGLGNDLQNAFIRSGLVQIIVLSGYNVMVVAEWVMTALAFAPLSLRMRATGGALALVAFVGIAGASATALRAALMALIALYARATGRSYTAGRALLVAIFLMLLWNPLYLAFDPGFGLSVAATAGLIWLAPMIETFLRKRRVPHFLRVSQVQRHPAAPFGAAGLSETLSKNAVGGTNSFWINALATTLAAQIAVLPLLLYDTGNLSLVSIPANLLVMPMVPLAMGFSFLAGFAGMLFGTFAPFIGIKLIDLILTGIGLG